MGKGFFITATDTGVGKTMTVYALALLLRHEGFNVGIMKPIQSGGDGVTGDAGFLKEQLGLTDDIRDINPYCSKEPLSPHLALSRAAITIDMVRIKDAFMRLQARYDIVLVEGAGGLLAPINGQLDMADLAKWLGLPIVVVSRLGLGTINHTLLTLREAERRGLSVIGVILSDMSGGKKGLPEKTNPEALRERNAAMILGTVPFLKKKDPRCVLSACLGKIDLEPFVRRVVRPTKELLAKDKKYVWHPFTQMKDWNADVPEVPLVIDRAEGVYLFDTDGNKYIDGISSLWVTVHGHGRREITDAIASQATRLDHSTMLGLANEPAVRLAEQLVRIAPKGLAKVFYSDNGSTSVEIAVKMAYQYWQNTGKVKKTTICHLKNSYHGDTLGSVSIGGIDLFHKVYRQLIFKTHQVDFPDCYRAPKGKKYPEYAFNAVDIFEAFVKKNHATLAALVVEPMVQGAAGMIMWPQGVLKRFEEICRKYDIFLICDEVATGFGRTGKMFACEHEEVTPDFMCVAKGLTGGVLPLAATLTTQRVFDGFLFPFKDVKTFFHGHTYTGNPIACAAALANLRIFKEERTLAALRPKIGHLARKLDGLRAIPFVGDVRQRGFMVGIELVHARSTQKAFPFEWRIGALVCARARQYGVILRPLGDVIVLMPPLSITTDELDTLVLVTERSILEVTAEIEKPCNGCGCFFSPEVEHEG